MFLMMTFLFPSAGTMFVRTLPIMERLGLTGNCWVLAHHSWWSWWWQGPAVAATAPHSSHSVMVTRPAAMTRLLGAFRSLLPTSAPHGSWASPSFPPSVSGVEEFWTRWLCDLSNSWCNWSSKCWTLLCRACSPMWFCGKANLTSSFTVKTSESSSRWM